MASTISSLVPVHASLIWLSCSFFRKKLFSWDFFFSSVHLKLDPLLLSSYWKQVWDRIAPGLASQFDSPYTIPAIAPRPLLIVNGNHFMHFNHGNSCYLFTSSRQHVI